MNKFLNRIIHHPIYPFIAIGLFAFVLYSFALNAPFKALDDAYSIVSNPTIHDIKNAPQLFTESFFGAGHYYRPLVALSFMIDYHFFGTNSLFYNLESLLIHITSAWIIFLFVSLLLNDRAKGFWVGFIFAIHPIHWEQLVNISGRAILLSGFFVFGSFYFYLLFQKYRHSLVHLIVSVVLCAAGLLCKESAAMLPIVLVGYLFLIKKAAFKEYVWLLPYFAVIAGYIGVRKLLGFTSTYPWEDAVQYTMGFLTFLSSVIVHIVSLIYPFNLHFDRSFVVHQSFTDPALLMTIILFGGVTYAFYQARTRVSPIVWFCLFWFFVELFPVAQVVTTIGVQPGVISTADHFLYVPSVAVFILIVLLGYQGVNFLRERNLASPLVCTFLIAGTLVGWMIMTQKQAVMGRSAITMLDQSVRHDPHNARVRTSLGLEYARINNFELAEQQFRESLRLRPDEPVAAVSLAQTLCDQRRLSECILQYEGIRDIYGQEMLYKKNLRQAYQQQAQFYQQLLKADPKNVELYYSLAIAQSKTGQVDAAIQTYLKALSIKPDFRMALFNLGAIYEGRHEPMKAAQYYEMMLDIDARADEVTDYARLRLIGLYTDLNMPKRLNKHRRLLKR